MTGRALLLALLAGTTAAAQQPPAAADAFAVRCARLHTGDGRVLEPGWMVVRGGKVDSVAGSEPASAGGLPLLDLGDRVVVPGLVVADSDLSGASDAEHQATPDFVAAEGFDFARRHLRALAGGVTTVYLSPGRKRLLPGQGSVVKLAGDDLLARVLADSACLRVTLGEDSLQAPALFEPDPAPTADNPLRPARPQVPSGRISQLAELRRLFREAQLAANDAGGHVVLGTGAAEDRFDPAPLLAVMGGRLPLRIAAARADDLRRALQLAGALGGRVVLENPAEIARVASLAARAGAAATFRLPVRPGQSNSGGEQRDATAPIMPLDAPAAAAAAGLKVALAPSDDGDLADMLLLAALAVRHGMEPEQALAAITGTAAQVLGVDGRVGTLAAGKDADFLVLSGAPLATDTVVERTFVDGRTVYERPATSRLLAVRARQLHAGDGSVIRDAVVLVEDGRVLAVGSGLRIPYGARVLTAEVATPGFVDGFSHAGLGSVGKAEIPRGAPDQLIAEAVAFDDPALRAALAGGVTTVVVAGRDAGTVSGRAAALKTGASDRDHLVVRETVALRLSHDEIGADTLSSLDSTLDRTRRYIEAWQRYEKAIAEGKEVILAPLDTRGGEDPVTGVWEGDLESEQIPFPVGFNLDLELDGENVTGQVTTVFRGRERPPTDIESGSFKDGRIRLEYDPGFGGALTISAEVSDDRMEGDIDGRGFFRGRFTARRVSKEPGAGGSGGNGDGRLRKPRVDEALEPMRAVLEGRATAVIRSARGPAIAAVARWAREANMRFALYGARDAAVTPELLTRAPEPATGDDGKPTELGPAPVGVMLEPGDVIDERDGERHNRARMLAEAGVPVALVSAATSGSAQLGVHAAYAVRHGLDPRTALAAITSEPARMLGIDDRVGTIAAGKDADLVLFTGDPFELTSRIVAVVCNGEVALDNSDADRSGK